VRFSELKSTFKFLENTIYTLGRRGRTLLKSKLVFTRGFEIAFEK
jgi:hypothetical protein